MKFLPLRQRNEISLMNDWARRGRGGPFSVIHSGRGQLTFTPPLTMSHAPFQQIGGQASYDYTTRTLLRTKSLAASLVTADEMTVSHLRRIALASTLGTMTALLDCTYIDLKVQLESNTDTKNMWEMLLQETSAVCSAISTAVTKRRIESWILSSLELYVQESGANMSSKTRVELLSGKQDFQDYGTKWIVGQSRIRNIDCPIQEGAMMILAERCEQHRIQNAEFFDRMSKNRSRT